jgi:hypothetical protein
MLFGFTEDGLDFLLLVPSTFRRHGAERISPRIEGRMGIGFYESGKRVTDADGNPSPPPQGFPG